jgi:hypothetical protein
MITNAPRSAYASSGAPLPPSAPVVNPRSSSSDFRHAPDPYEEASKKEREEEAEAGAA